jgi:hypothetical protein
LDACGDPWEEIRKESRSAAKTPVARRESVVPHP